MATARLKFDGKEIAFGPGPATIGRTGDNTVSFPDNANVSRNHATIEFRDGAFRLTDLGSSNGTAVNGVRIDGETEVFDGDYITLGNSVILQFFEDEREEEPAGAAPEGGTGATPEQKSSKAPLAIGLAGAVGGLAVVFAAAAVYVGLSGPSTSCTNAARIVSPRNGDTISKETDIRIEVTDSLCAQRVIVVLNEKTIAEFDSEPYETKLDPNKHPELADGRYYQLQVVLVGPDGTEVAQASRLELGFETREVETPTPTIAAISPTPTPAKRTTGQITLDETRTMAANVVRKFTGVNARYNLSNPDFLKEVRDRSTEYATPGYFQRAAAYRDTINQYFVREKTLDPSLGFILAMSRSKFDPAAKDQNLGLWRMSNDFATVNAYNVVCENFNLGDPGQQCAARVAAYYIRDLIDAFDGDIVYAAAAFGKTAAEANGVKTGLPADHTDFWKSLPDPAMREQVARFFAAAIVAENPQRFKLAGDRPISELYPVTTN